MTGRRSMLIVSVLLALVGLACANVALFAETPQVTLTPAEAAPTFIEPTAIPLPEVRVEPGAANPNEPVFISGRIPFTSPFFLNSIAEPFVLLEDEAGFVKRDLEFPFTSGVQTIGPVEFIDSSTLFYRLPLPSIPQGTYVDVDNDGESDTGVQVFAIAYWSNTWGDPFLEERDGMGWSTAYASTRTDPERDYEIEGGILMVWSPDDEQAFPVGFGEDRKLFTDDDLVETIPAGYSIVDLDDEPFRIYKEAQPRINLLEGEIATNDYSSLSYVEAFDALFEKVSREYPFTEDKGIDWQALYDQVAPEVASARSDRDFYLALREFVFAIPDGHVGGLFDRTVFFEERSGGFGLVLAELSDGRVIVTHVLPDTPAEDAGIEVGAEIVEWDGSPVAQAINAVEPRFFSSYSTEHTRRLDQVVFLTHVPEGTRVTVAFQNPGEDEEEVTMRAVSELDSLFEALFPARNEIGLPVEGKILEDSGLAYIRIASFSDDYNLSARIWDRFMRQLVENEVPGLIIDLRRNGGGSGGLAGDFAGYFFDEEIVYGESAYYSEATGQFEFYPIPLRIKPGPMYYEGPVVLLVGPDCVSACEGFAYKVALGGRATVIGHYPTAGAYGEVGRGQYDLPGGLSLQVPTGRYETSDGTLILEGTGLVPDIVVPVIEDSALGRVDAVLEAAVEYLLDQLE